MSVQSAGPSHQGFVVCCDIVISERGSTQPSLYCVLRLARVTIFVFTSLAMVVNVDARVLDFLLLPRLRDLMIPPTTRQIPQQTNDCDCGVYVIHYAKLILQNPPTMTQR